jgi:hypothetical protein
MEKFTVMDKKIKKHWETPFLPGSFTNPNKIWRSMDKKGKKDIKNRENLRNVLFGVESYLTHRKAKYRFKRRKVISPSINYQWDCDVAYLEYKDDNKPFMGFLCCIDIFSRKVYACLIENVSAKSIIKCFKNIFKEIKPKRIRTDLGVEFKSRETTAFLKKENVILFHTNNNLIKSNYCERVIYTIKSKIAKYLIHYNTHVWKTVFSSIIKSYNNTYHSVLKQSPNSVNVSDEDKIWHRLYLDPYLRGKIKPPYWEKYLYKVNDIVVVSMIRSTFHRGWQQNFSFEYFTVIERKKSEGICLYKLKDQQNQILKGWFQSNEMQISLIDYKKYVFKIREVIKKRGAYSLVAWLGWPRQYNSYVLTSQIKDINNNKVYIWD